MTKSPAFQFYAKDWLSSSKITLMPPEFEGAYIRLLAYCWDSGDCSIPDDDNLLASLSRLAERWLNGGSTVVRKCFIPHPAKPGYLTNQRLLDEAAKQASWKNKSSEGGKKSAEQRAEKKRQSKGGSTNEQPTASTVVQPKGNIASASSSASASASSSALTSTKEPYHPTTVGFDEIYDCGVKFFPTLADKYPGVIRTWLEGGGVVKEICDEIEKSKGKSPGSWEYFDPAINRAIKATKHAPKPVEAKPMSEEMKIWWRRSNSSEKSEWFKVNRKHGEDEANRHVLEKWKSERGPL